MKNLKFIFGGRKITSHNTRVREAQLSYIAMHPASQTAFALKMEETIASPRRRVCFFVLLWTLF